MNYLYMFKIFACNNIILFDCNIYLSVTKMTGFKAFCIKNKFLYILQDLKKKNAHITTTSGVAKYLENTG